MTKTVLRALATSSTALAFTVIAVSGILMYFHLFSVQVKELHEILGLVFVAAVAGHLWVNWKGMRGYFSKKLFAGLGVLTAGVSLLFVLGAPPSGSDPKGMILAAVLKAPLETSAPLLGSEAAQAAATLEAAGYGIGDADSIEAVAKRHGTSPFRIVQLIGTAE